MVRRRSLRIMWNNFVIRHVTMIARKGNGEVRRDPDCDRKFVRKVKPKSYVES